MSNPTMGIPKYNNASDDQSQWSPQKRARMVYARKQIENTPGLRDEILFLLSKGATLSEVCRLPHMPDREDFMKWVKTDPEYRAKYEDAKTVAATAIVDEAMDVARQVTESPDDDPLVARARSVVANSYADVALKYAAALAPRTYGQLLKVSDSSGNGLTVTIASFASMEANAETQAPIEPEKATSSA